MSEESDLEKTEEASERRLEKAREDGDVARSRELVTTLVILGTGISGPVAHVGDSLGKPTSDGALQHAPSIRPRQRLRCRSTC
jgi:flagellar biosynthetic protein FlhB